MGVSVSGTYLMKRGKSGFEYPTGEPIEVCTGVDENREPGQYGFSKKELKALKEEGELFIFTLSPFSVLSIEEFKKGCSQAAKRVAKILATRSF